MNSLLPPCLLAAILALTGITRAQDIVATVGNNSNGSDTYVDIKNTTSGTLYFHTDPSPPAQMAIYSGLGGSVFNWPSVNFGPDPSAHQINRVWSGSYLRVFPKTTPVGSVITIPFSYTQLGTRYNYRVTVVAGAKVTQIGALDPPDGGLSSVRWKVDFDTPISNVTAANFVLEKGQMAGVSMTSVTPDTAQPSTSWTVTANSGTSQGQLSLNWAGQQTETPPVPSTFVGQATYNFGKFVAFPQDLAPTPINVDRGTTTTLAITAIMRDNVDGIPMSYQWYSGPSNASNPTAIQGATGPSYTPPTFNTTGTYQYHCKAWASLNPAGTLRSSSTGTVVVSNFPKITTQPVNRVAGNPQGITLSVQATGDNLAYQWYQGVAPDTSAAIYQATGATYATGARNQKTSYWVQVKNGAGVTVNSNTAAVTFVGSVTPQLASYKAPVNSAFPTPFTVTVKDPQGATLPDIGVMWIAPLTPGAASGTFQNANPAYIAYTNTNSNGVSTAPTYTANGVAGTYNVAVQMGDTLFNIPTANLPNLNVAAVAGFTNTVATPSYSLATATNAAPTGGTFSGPGVSSGTFNPASAGIGTHTITYTLNGAQVTFVITVTEAPSLVVTTAADTVNANDGQTSLREAMVHANSLTDAQTITFAAALAGQTVTLDKGWSGSGDATALVASRQLTIQGLTTAPGVTIAMATGVQKRHLYVASSGALTLSNLSFSSGYAPDYGGSVWSQGSLTVKGCTFTGNQSVTEGGAIQSWGDSPLLKIENSTFSGNSSVVGSAFDGGALQMSFHHLTVTNNTATSGQAVVLWKNPGTFINCLIAGNSGEGIGLLNGASLSSQSTNNLLGAGASGGLVNGVNGNLLGVATTDLKLGPFSANGSPTRTYSLFQDSPAVDAGAAVAGITLDQRGLGRTQLLKPDIGAFEYVPGGLRAEFYNNRTLSGFPVLVRRDATVDFSANGTTSPAPGVNATGFSARWTGFVVIPTTGSYTFHAAGDDGIRLWVGDMAGAPAVNQWTEKPETEYATGSYQFTAGQRVPVKLEFDQATGGAAARLRWQGPSIAKAIIPANHLVPSMETPGLKAEFFTNKTLNGSPAATRVDTSIDFNWSTSPASGVGSTDFSARWTGFIDIPTTGTYTFQVAADDGVRLWVGDVSGAATVDKWLDQGETEYSTGNLVFTAGQRVPVKVEYYQGSGGAVMRLRWQGPGISKGIIPLGSLYAPIEQAVSPLIATPSGIVGAPSIISLSSTIPGAMIRYTIDGTQPTPATGLIYGSPVILENNATLRAIAFKEGHASSAVAMASYTLAPQLEAWRWLHGLDSNGSQDLAKPASDGIANLLKYAFNMAPAAGNLVLPNVVQLASDGSAGLPLSYQDTEGRLVIQFVRRKAINNPGITYIVETGTNPAVLTPLDPGAAVVVSIDAVWERVTVTDPTATPGRFGRVRVTTTTP